MIPVDQEFIDGDGQGRPGDCLRACIASILDLDRGQVPHFVDVPPHADWMRGLTLWLQDHGFAMDWRDPPVWPQPDAVGGHCIAIGRSPRGFTHGIVADAATGELVHDPHPARGMFTTGTFAAIVVRAAP